MRKTEPTCCSVSVGSVHVSFDNPEPIIRPGSGTRAALVEQDYEEVDDAQTAPDHHAAEGNIRLPEPNQFELDDWVKEKHQLTQA